MQVRWPPRWCEWRRRWLGSGILLWKKKMSIIITIRRIVVCLSSQRTKKHWFSISSKTLKSSWEVNITRYLKLSMKLKNWRQKWTPLSRAIECTIWCWKNSSLIRNLSIRGACSWGVGKPLCWKKTYLDTWQICNAFKAIRTWGHAPKAGTTRFGAQNRVKVL